MQRSSLDAKSAGKLKRKRTLSCELRRRNAFPSLREKVRTLRVPEAATDYSLPFALVPYSDVDWTVVVQNAPPVIRRNPESST